LSTLSANTTCQLDILRHDSNSLSMNGAEIGVFKQTNEISLASLLQRHNSRALETKIRFEVLSNLTDETLERQFTDQQFSALLVATNFSKSHSSGPITMRLLHSASGRRALTSGFGRQLFSGSLASGRLACCLLSTSHFLI
ncbi:hypothetical protein ALC62_13404, partial [Cyphomyrmex costatus]